MSPRASKVNTRTLLDEVREIETPLDIMSGGDLADMESSYEHRREMNEAWERIITAQFIDELRTPPHYDELPFQMEVY